METPPANAPWPFNSISDHFLPPSSSPPTSSTTLFFFFVVCCLSDQIILVDYRAKARSNRTFLNYSHFIVSVQKTWTQTHLWCGELICLNCVFRILVLLPTLTVLWHSEPSLIFKYVFVKITVLLFVCRTHKSVFGGFLTWKFVTMFMFLLNGIYLIWLLIMPAN